MGWTWDASLKETVSQETSWINSMTNKESFPLHFDWYTSLSKLFLIGYRDDN